MNTPKVELWLGANYRWYFHKRNANGKISNPSQGYKQKRYAKEAIKRELPNLPIVDLSLNG